MISKEQREIGFDNGEIDLVSACDCLSDYLDKVLSEGKIDVLSLRNVSGTISDSNTHIDDLEATLGMEIACVEKVLEIGQWIQRRAEVQLEHLNKAYNNINELRNLIGGKII